MASAVPVTARREEVDRRESNRALGDSWIRQVAVVALQGETMRFLNQTMPADYDVRRRRLWPVALVVILLAPWLWGKAGLAGRR